MKSEPMNLATAGCSVLYIIAYLFLPFLQIPFSASVAVKDLLTFASVLYLPLIVGILMGACALLAPKQVTVIVGVVGAFLPMLLFSNVKGMISELTNTMMNNDQSSIALQQVPMSFLTMGWGIFVTMLLGVGVACLSLLSGTPKSKTPPTGLTANDDNDW